MEKSEELTIKATKILEDGGVKQYVLCVDDGIMTSISIKAKHSFCYGIVKKLNKVLEYDSL